MLPPMSGDGRGGASGLKGRLADVYVPALVEGSLSALSRRLGNRATIDDPVFGRASTLSSIDPLLERAAQRFDAMGVTYRRVASATGVDRDISEGVLTKQTPEGPVEMPIAVVAERRRMREIELRVYYATGEAERKQRTPMLSGSDDVAVPQIVAHILDALRKGAVERVLAGLEEASRFVDPVGKTFQKRDGAMAEFIGELASSRMELVAAGAADDGRTCLVEALLTRPRLHREPEPAALSFERGDSGLVRELRFYYEP